MDVDVVWLRVLKFPSEDRVTESSEVRLVENFDLMVLPKGFAFFHSSYVAHHRVSD